MRLEVCNCLRNLAPPNGLDLNWRLASRRPQGVSVVMIRFVDSSSFGLQLRKLLE